jgi:hypothetical protein
VHSTTGEPAGWWVSFGLRRLPGIYGCVGGDLRVISGLATIHPEHRMSLPRSLFFILDPIGRGRAVRNKQRTSACAFD